MNVSAQLNRLSQRTGKKLETVVRETLVQLGTSIVIKTPVRDGYAKGGWVAQVGFEPTASPEIEDKTGSISINAVQAVAGKLDIGQTFFYVNALPYAKKLEDGSSAQAGDGMVKVSVAELPGILDRQIARVR